LVGRSNYTGNYKAVVFLDSVCSISPLPNDAADDTMLFSIILRVEDHPSLGNSTTDDVSTELTYGPGQQWLDVQSISVMAYMYTTYTFTNQTVSPS